MAMRRRRLRPGEARQGRRALRRAEIGPDDAAHLHGGIGRDEDLVLEVQTLRLVHHVHAPAVDVELPAVEDAAQSALLVAAEEQRGAAMRAMLLDQPDAVPRIA